MNDLRKENERLNFRAVLDEIALKEASEENERLEEENELLKKKLERALGGYDYLVSHLQDILENPYTETIVFHNNESFLKSILKIQKEITLMETR